jgi:large repetitive protein
MSRWLRRAALATVVVFGVTLAVPADAVPAGGSFPLSWLSSWQRSAWALAGVPGGPAQPHGHNLGLSGYVSADATRANRGVGSEQHKVPQGLDGYKPHGRDVKETTTPAAAKGFNASTSRRDAAKSAANMDYFTNADGSTTRRVYGGRKNFKGTDGSWQPIDPKLVKGPQGRWQMAANSLQVSLKGTAGGQGGAAALSAPAPSPLVSMSLPTGEVLSYDLQNASVSAPTIDGGKATYADVLPHTDMELEAYADGLNEFLVLDSPDAPSQWLFPLQLQGLTPRLTDDGSVEFLNSAGSPVAWFPHGSMQDSKFNQQTGEMTHSSAISFSLTDVNGQPALRVTADAAWLHDPARVYPVRVDPTTTTGTTGDVYVDNDSGTGSSDQNGDNLAVGTYDGGTTKARSFIHLDDFDTSTANKQRITAASLKLFLTWQYSCANARSFSVTAATGSWTVAGLSTTAWPGPAIDGSAMGSLTVDDPGSACTNTGSDRSVGKWVTVPMNSHGLAVLNGWSGGGSSNLGIALTTSETDSNSWKRFTSANYGSGAYMATMDLTYVANIKPQIDTWYPGDNAIVQTLTPELTVRAHDPDNYPARGLAYGYQVFDPADTTTYIDASGWLYGNPNYKVSAGKLKWNKTYLYRLTVSDYVTQTNYGPFYSFTTSVPQPLLTSNLSQNEGKGYDPSIGNYTTAAVDASVVGVGPSLEVSRNYNSLDLRKSGAFGQGWSSVIDSRATQKSDVDGTVQSVVLTYPTGQEVAFGRNGDGSFTPASGRYSILKATMSGTTVTGYTLTDKDATVYAFGKSAGNGVFKITSVTDANGRTLSFTYDATTGDLVTMKSASGRKLTFTWAATTAPTVGKHVATVTTDPPTTGAAGYQWTYTYGDYDRLTKVCPPNTVSCTQYAWDQWTNNYVNATLNAGPYSYWRLNETSGTSARSSVLNNAGVDNGVYKNVTLGSSAALTNSTSTSATFNGTSSYVQLPGKLVQDGSYQSISMWFKTTAPNGVLFSYNATPITSTSSGSYTPALYIDNGGYLRGELYMGNAAAAMKYSAKPVTDGAWHHVVLAGAGTTQTLYVDGASRATLAGTIALANATNSSYSYVGAGFVGGGWPDHAKTGASPPAAQYFTGQISDVAFFTQALTAGAVSDMYAAGSNGSSVMTNVRRPTGRVTAQVAYSTVTGQVTSVTDDNGGTWTMGTPKVVGDSDVYEASVLGGKPTDYWRLDDTGEVVDAVNEVNGGTATYSTVTLGATGPFKDRTATTFNGTSSSATEPQTTIDTTKSFSISVFANPIAVANQRTLVSVAGTTQSVFNLAFNGTNNKWHVEMAQSDATNSPVNSVEAPATLGTATAPKWAHLTATYTATDRKLRLYVNGVKAGETTVGGTAWNGSQLYIGRVLYNGSEVSFWHSGMAELAVFDSALTDDQIADQYAASTSSVPVAYTTVDTTATPIPMPVKVVTVTDPGGKTLAYSYDLVNGNRMVSQTDTLGNVTRYGYDTGGFSNLTYDPNGSLTQTVQDERGNTIQQITCQDQSQHLCSSVYYEYYPPDPANPADPRTDQMTSMRDGRSASAADNTYLTSYTFDPKGNPTVTTDALGQTTTTSYTDGTTTGSFDGGIPPLGLPVKIVNASGGVQTIDYYTNGDIGRVTTPAGKVTTYAYDGLGRKVAENDVTSTFSAGRRTTYRYDEQDRVVSQTDPEVTNRVTGAVHTQYTANTYDADGNMLTQTTSDPSGGDVTRTQSVTFNSFGQKASQTDALGKTISFTYDLYGNVIREDSSDGTSTKYDLDAEGNVLKTWTLGFTGDPNNPSAPVDKVLQSRQYDPNGRVATETDAMGWTTSYTYTDDGLLSTVTRSDGTSSFVVESDTYDKAGNLTNKVSSNGGTTEKYEYDALGRLYRTTLDPAGLNRVTTDTLSPMGDVLSTNSRVGNAGSIVAQTDRMYDLEGRVIGETKYNGDPATTPVGRWKLNETSGTVAKDSTGNAKMTATNVAWTNDATRGPVASFDGTSAQVTYPQYPADTQRDNTVSAWVKLGAKNGAYQFVLTVAGANGSSALKLAYAGAVDKWSLETSQRAADGTSVWTSTQGPAGQPQVGVWTHLVGVVSASTKTVSLYVNGSLANSQTGTTPFNNLPTNEYIGSQGGNYYFNGAISDVQAYQSALTPAQVTAVYNGSAPVSTATVSRTRYKVDNGGLALSSTDPNGNATDVSYDEADRPAVVTGASVTAETVNGTVTARPVTYIGYDTFGDKTETVDGNGNRTVHVFDRGSREYETHLPSYTPPGSSTAITPVVSQVFDSMSQVTSSTDASGKTTSYTYDQLGRLAKVTTPNAGVTKMTYDMAGDLLSTTDPTGAVSSTTYDYLSRKVTSTQAVRQTGENDVTKYDYDTAGRLQAVTSPGGVKQSYAYNPAGEPLTVTDAVNNKTTYGYDGLGRVWKTTNPDNTYSQVNYDMLSQATATASYSAAGVAQARTYASFDAVGNRLSTTDAMGVKNTFTYDASGAVISETQPVSATDSITTSFGYDLAGNPTRFTDGRGNAFWTAYNSWNKPESQIEPATAAYPNVADRTYTTVYDVAGRVAQQRLPGGVTQTYAYDDMGQLTTESGTGAEAATTDRTFGYDLAGRVTNLTGSGGSTSIAYDDRGLPTAITGGSGNSSFAYTSDSTMASRTDAAGTTSYTYDTAGRLKTAKNTAAGVDIAYAYNAMSQVSSRTYSGGGVRSFTYDDLHRVLSDELKTSSGVSVARIDYGWDLNSNETSKKTTNFNGTTTTNTYSYDQAGRLTNWNNGSADHAYAYDKSGNLITNGGKYLLYDAQNRLTGDGASTYTYTARGTLASQQSGSGTLNTTSDAFGQVLSQDSASGTQTYTYDGLGRAIKPGFAYTGQGNDLASDGSATYVRDPSGDVLGETAGGDSRLAWTDMHSDVVGQFQATGTTLDASTTYDPYGKIVATAGMLGHLGYQSEWTDELTGRVDMLARWYNPDTGRFDSRDTVANSPMPASIGANRYEYGDGMPTTVTDPSGHCSFWNVACHAKSVVNAWNNSSIGQAVNNGVSAAYHWTASVVSSVASRTMDRFSRFADDIGMHSVSKWAHQKSQHLAKKAQEHKRKAVEHYQKAKKAAHHVASQVVRHVTKVVKKVKDAAKKTGKWIKDHKNAIIEVAAVVVTIAATVALGPVGGVLVGMAVSVAKDAAEGKIHSLSDLGKSALSAVATGAIGAMTGGIGGVIGGKVAGAIAGKVCAGLMRRVVSGAVGGALSGGIGGALGDIGTQLWEHHSVNWHETASAAITGAVLGGVGGAIGGARAKTPCSGHSFDPKTPVEMADGTQEPIGDIKVGDKVRATDPKTGKTEAKSVTALHNNHDTDLADVTIKDTKSGKTTTLHATWHHPFWNASSKQWTEASDLKAGDRLRDANGQTTQMVVAVKIWTGLAWMRDLTVDDIHTYYVMAGATPVLVHNTGVNCENAPNSDGNLYRGVHEGHDHYDAAGEGRAVPNGGHSDPARHAAGDTNSEMTSWSHDIDEARTAAADRGGDGIILRVPHEDVPYGRDRQIHGTDDEMYEEWEHQIYGEFKAPFLSRDGGETWESTGG